MQTRWWVVATGALVLVAFLFSITGSLLVTALALAGLAAFLAYQIPRARLPEKPKVHYCRRCGEILSPQARECRSCGSASWSIRE